jgi:hypothetical protein
MPTKTCSIVWLAPLIMLSLIIKIKLEQMAYEIMFATQTPRYLRTTPVSPYLSPYSKSGAQRKKRTPLEPQSQPLSLFTPYFSPLPLLLRVEKGAPTQSLGGFPARHKRSSLLPSWSSGFRHRQMHCSCQRMRRPPTWRCVT